MKINVNTLHLSIIAILVLIVGASNNVSAQIYDDVLKKFTSDPRKPSKLEYNGATIVINQTISRLKLLDLNEHLLVHPEIANMGNASTNLCYMWKPFFLVIYENETRVWIEPNAPSVGTLEYNCMFVKELKPNESFSHLALFYSKVDSITLFKPGNYTIYSVTDFYHNEHRTDKVSVWSKPYNFTILPDKPVTVDPAYDVSPPLQQIKHSISWQEVTCTAGTYIVWHHDHKSVACVKLDHISKLVKRGWLMG